MYLLFKFLFCFFFADFEPRDAEALFDYSARSSKELSFKKGDIIRVFKRFNPDWWDGTINGTDGFVPAKYIRINNDDNDNDITDSEGSVSVPGELTPSPKVLSSGDRPRDLNVPPRIPKREGSLRGRDSIPSPTSEVASPLGPSPQTGGMSSFKKTSLTGTPVSSSSSGPPAISSEDIVKRQLNLLRKAPKEEKETDGSVDKTPEKDQPSFAMPRLRSISPPRKSSPSQEKEGGTPDETRNATKEEHRRSSDVIWQPRGESPGNRSPPGSPRSTTAPKVPPAVLPKPKGGSRNPAPPFRKNSDDLLASLHAAQAVRSHRGGSTGEDPRKSRGSVGDDTAF